MSARIAIVAVLVAAACGPGGRSNNHGDGGSHGADAPIGPHVLDAISVTPTNPIVQLNLNATAEQAFKATAEYEDGTSEDVTTQVTWTVANPAVGAMTAATLMIPSFNAASAEVSTITAELGTGSAAKKGQAQITVVAYQQTGPDEDFFFILPYQDTAGPQMKPLDFSTAVPALDVFFLQDTTGSMYGEIANVQTALTGTIVPGIQAAVANAQFGVGAFDDFPVNGDADGIGADGTLDQPLKLRQAITPTTSLIQTAVNGLSTGGSPIGNGGDLPEAGIEALYQVATGAGLTGPSPTSVPANHTGVGGVGFRTGTMPVIVSISDASSHTVGADPNNPSCGDTYASSPANIPAYAHTNAQTVTALNAICARVVGIAPVNGTCDAENYYTAFATATGARVPPAAWDVGVRPAGCSATQCCVGQSGSGMAVDADGLCPLVFRASTSGTGVSSSVVTGINMLTRFAQFDVTRTLQGVTTDTSGNPLPAPHTTADFLTAVTPASFMLPPPPPALPDPTIDTATQGFDGVTPGTTVTFTVNAFNNFVPQTSQPQIFKATIQVLAAGCTTLSQHDVLILVPPTPIVIN
jgi:hypothetical protein